jgi:hypothetical protein
MATATDPTASGIVAEAYRKTAYTPLTSDLTTGTTVLLQEILNDIWLRSVSAGNTRLKSLETKAYFNSVAGQSYVAMGEDFDEEITVVLLDGSIRSTAQAGAAQSITLAASDAMSLTVALGRAIFLTGGTGAGQIRYITAINTTTKVVTVDSAWTVQPDATTTYLIVQNTMQLDQMNAAEFDTYMPIQAGKPTVFAKYGRQLNFEKPFDLSTYGIMVRYYANIHQIDLTEGPATLFTRILRNWRSVLTQGVTWKILESQNDNQQKDSMGKYEQLVGALVLKEIPFDGEFTGFVL